VVLDTLVHSIYDPINPINADTLKVGGNWLIDHRSKVVVVGGGVLITLAILRKFTLRKRIAPAVIVSADEDISPDEDNYSQGPGDETYDLGYPYSGSSSYTPPSGKGIFHKVGPLIAFAAGVLPCFLPAKSRGSSIATESRVSSIIGSTGFVPTSPTALLMTTRRTRRRSLTDRHRFIYISQEMGKTQLSRG